MLTKHRELYFKQSFGSFSRLGVMKYAPRLLLTTTASLFRKVVKQTRTQGAAILQKFHPTKIYFFFY